MELSVAITRLAQAIEECSAPDSLGEFFLELFPERPQPVNVDGVALANYVRAGIYPEEVVDLWHVVFPRERVYYDEETRGIHVIASRER